MVRRRRPARPATEHPPAGFRRGRTTCGTGGAQPAGEDRAAVKVAPTEPGGRKSLIVKDDGAANLGGEGNTMLACLALGLVLVMRFWPNCTFSRVLHKHLVERPVRWCAKVERHRIIQTAILLVLLFSAGEIVSMFGSEFLFAYSFDLSLYIDCLIVTAALAAASYLKATARYLRARWSFGRLPAFRPFRRAAREPRARKPRAEKPADNDDRPGWTVALAA
jgi:hypothetical protein